jgi:hypothetical protein
VKWKEINILIRLTHSHIHLVPTPILILPSVLLGKGSIGLLVKENIMRNLALAFIIVAVLALIGCTKPFTHCCFPGIKCVQLEEKQCKDLGGTPAYDCGKCK